MTDEQRMIKEAVSAIAKGLGEQKVGIAEAIGGGLYLVERTAANVGRIADALERIADKIAPEKPVEPKRDFFGAPKE